MSPARIAMMIDLFLDHEATTAMIDPNPIPPSMALSVKSLLVDWASISDDINTTCMNIREMKRPIWRSLL